MPEITLNRDDALKVLGNPRAGSDARLIAAFTLAFFEAHDQASEIAPETRAITLKLAHMCASAIYDGAR